MTPNARRSHVATKVLTQPQRRWTDRATPVSALLLCDRLIGLAKEAEGAGYITTADRLVRLMDEVFEEPASRA